MKPIKFEDDEIVIKSDAHKKTYVYINGKMINRGTTVKFIHRTDSSGKPKKVGLTIQIGDNPDED